MAERISTRLELLTRMQERAAQVEWPEQRPLVVFYTPNTGGHRHIYAHALADTFIGRGWNILLAHYGLLQNLSLSFTNRRYSEHPSAHLDAMRNNPAVQEFNIGPDFGRTRFEMDVLWAVQKTFSPNLTFIIDCDDLRYELALQGVAGNPTLESPTAGIFMRFEFRYNPFVAPRVSQNFEKAFDQNFFWEVLPNVRPVDFALCTDENFVEEMNLPHILNLPEVPRPKRGDEQREPTEFVLEMRESLRRFIGRYKPEDIVLLFGDVEKRKNFAFYLRLVKEVPELAMVRIGRTKPGEMAEWDTLFLREHLIRQRRLFEFDYYVEDQETIDMAFHATEYMFLPYQDFFRTSAVMMQALSYGKPVLVPDGGLLRDRVQRHNLGLVFANGDYDSFKEQALRLRGTAKCYVEDVKKYAAESFSTESLDAAIGTLLERIQAENGEGAGAPEQGGRPPGSYSILALQLKEVEATAAKLYVELKSKIEELRTQQALVAQQAAQIGAQPTEIEQQQRVIDELHRQLNEIHRSKSWRLSGPLRRAGRILRGHR